MKIKLVSIVVLAVFWGACAVHAQQPLSQAQTATLLNNKGNLFFMKSSGKDANWDSAKVYYQRAVASDPEDPGILLNLAICHIVEDDTVKSDSLLQAAFLIAGLDSSKIFHLLGMFVQDTTPQRGAPNDSIKITETRIRNKMSLNFAQAKEKKKPKEEKPKEEKPKEKPKPTKNTLGERAADPHLYQTFLYWRQ